MDLCFPFVFFYFSLSLSFLINIKLGKKRQIVLSSFLPSQLPPSFFFCFDCCEMIRPTCPAGVTGYFGFIMHHSESGSDSARKYVYPTQSRVVSAWSPIIVTQQAPPALSSGLSIMRQFSSMRQTGLLSSQAVLTHETRPFPVLQVKRTPPHPQRPLLPLVPVSPERVDTPSASTPVNADDPSDAEEEGSEEHGIFSRCHSQSSQLIPDFTDSESEGTAPSSLETNRPSFRAGGATRNPRKRTVSMSSSQPSDTDSNGDAHFVGGRPAKKIRKPKVSKYETLMSFEN